MQNSLMVNLLVKDQINLCIHKVWSGPEVIKLFSCSAQLSMKFHLVIKIKIPTIKTFFSAQLSWACSAELSMKDVLNKCQYLKIYEQNKFHAQLSWHEKSSITSGPGLFSSGKSYKNNNQAKCAIVLAGDVIVIYQRVLMPRCFLRTFRTVWKDPLWELMNLADIAMLAREITCVTSCLLFSTPRPCWKGLFSE